MSSLTSRKSAFLLWGIAALSLFLAAGCAGVPGRDYPRREPTGTNSPPNEALAEPFRAEAHSRNGTSAFRLYSLGVDGLLLRLELIARANSSLDLQYYIFRGDESGKLITEALMQAAQRGVRIRLLIDDGETVRGDEQLFALAASPSVSIRIFNPWRYRGHNYVVRGSEFLFNKSRLDYRMHNKLFVADGVIALIGGRNIGDQYFQVDPDSQYADDDVVVAGQLVPQLKETFEKYWQSDLAIPAQALVPHEQYGADRADALAARRTSPEKASAAGSHFVEKLTAGEPLSSLLSGSAPVVWARAEIACDSPDKKSVARGERVGSLMFGTIADAVRQTQSELLMVTPYLVPTADEQKLLTDRTESQRRVRILTTSLEATTDPVAEAGYDHHRVALLKSGVELYELRTHPETSRGSGQSAQMTRNGTYSLHAKLLIFDRKSIFVGSMNYDARSRWLNTEMGLVIYSPELAAEGGRRFDAMTQPASAYAVTLHQPDSGGAPVIVWSTVEQGKPVTYTKEPSRSTWQRMEVRTLSLLPLDHEL
ncbi:MAG TPA: phospholipase D family protein [Steroidobacteraceae bacterium]|jgi:putative cardiolipin synthase